ncbi:MAG: TetR/AcrR family transcriptional regulator [Parvularculaceae bacterium]
MKQPKAQRAMPQDPETTPRDDVVAALYSLFRCGGYDGVSLSDISAATGLGKSSLYHYFPKGKPDMAEAVADFGLKSVRAKVIAPLSAELPLEKKIATMLRAVDSMYDGGRAPCLVANMLPSGAASVSLRAILSEWIDALAAALGGAGVKPGIARARAVAALVAIEGALIVVQATGEGEIFAEILTQVGADLTKR